MYRIKINFTLVQVYFPFTRKCKGYENEFKLQKKKYTEISATLPSPQKASILKTMVYMVFYHKQPLYNIFSTRYQYCGLLGTLSIDIAYLVIHN